LSTSTRARVVRSLTGVRNSAAAKCSLPHHDRVGHRTEQHQMQREPAGAGDTAGRREPTGEQAGKHEGGRQHMPSAAPAQC
jgi:hypothetical protein